MSTKGKRITISREETTYRERSFTRAQIIDMLTDELSEPVMGRKTLANMNDAELAAVLAELLNGHPKVTMERLRASDDVIDMLTEGYYELYERDSSDGDFTVEVQK